MEDIERISAQVMVGPQDIFSDVAFFHQKFNIGYAGPPRDLPVMLDKFRRKFLDEEYDEWILAKKASDRPGQLDALIDMMYVIAGTIYLHGWNGREAWRRVQVANMAKVISKIPCDKMIIKPEGWIAPDHSDLV